MWRRSYGLLACSIGFVLLCLACSQMTPTPEVEVTSFDPIGLYVTAADTSSDIWAGPNESVEFTCFNYVDAVVTNVSYAVYNKEGDAQLFGDRELLHVNLSVPGDACAVYLYNLVAPVNDVIDRMYSDDITAVYITFTFWGEDAFGYGKTFSDSLEFGLARLD